MKLLSNVLSKTAGLVFFSFLAISLGVVFGLLFEGWVKDQPGTPVGSGSENLQAVELPVETTKISNSNEAEKSEKLPAKEEMTPTTNNPVKFKVRVGPFAQKDQAVTTSQKLEAMGYPIYVNNQAPFVVQVGAFATEANASILKEELNSKGYKVFIEKK